MSKLLSRHLDKIAHFFAGAFIFHTLHTLSSSQLIGFAVVLIAAFLKEVIDHKETGFNKLDILATLLGGLIAYLTVLTAELMPL